VGAVATKQVFLSARGVSKAFPGVQALDEVDFEAKGGEVVALVGENGAGKSTLMKILAGLHRPDSGTVSLHGEQVALQSPLDALHRGIALIHQELNLCDNLTVSGAMFLGAELRRGPFLREREMAASTRHWLSRLGLEIDPRTKVADLRPGQRQMLEIARALRSEARILIMDEPTSSLAQVEVERLFEVVRDLQQKGIAVIYITHRLSEIAVLADRVVGLRDGRNSGSLSRDQIDHDALVQLMVGRELSGIRRKAHTPGAVALEVRGVRTRSYPAAEVDLTVRRGELVAIAGLLGSGRSELLRALFGVDSRMAGSVAVAGSALRVGEPRAAVAAGVALLPEDRKSEGLVLSMSVAENLSLPTLHRRGWWLDQGYQDQLAKTSIADLGIACRNSAQMTSSLSGGNQQKIVLGKWLATNPQVLLLDEPTRGVDVGARAEIYRRLDELANAGLAVLFVSSELEEVLLLADRVLVMHDGAIQGEVAGDAMTEENIMLLATGSKVS
tara:strand:+ start:8794 stop:10296 length:1503 start_codon:yes stop_codon:yes gene_type:complete